MNLINRGGKEKYFACFTEYQDLIEETIRTTREESIEAFRKWRTWKPYEADPFTDGMCLGEFTISGEVKYIEGFRKES